MSEQARRECRSGVKAARRPEGAPASEKSGNDIPDGPDGPLLTLLWEACGGETARDAVWRIEPGADAHGGDVRVSNDRAGVPEQGWKLHISADPDSAEAVLRRALPVLLAEDASFKVISSVLRLGMLNSGNSGLSQVGKFLTVYPNDDAQAVRLAVALNGATRGLSGPVVPSDRPLSTGSLVHYRYGGFGMKLIQAPTGEILPAVTAPNGELVPDRRTTAYRAPEWAVDPFAAAGVAGEIEATGNTPGNAPSKAVGGRYVIMDTLYYAPRGAVYRALDLQDLRRCVLKQRKRDTHDYLRNEAAVLARLAPDKRFPEVFGLAEGEEDDLFLSLEPVEGETLGERIGDLARFGRHASPEQVVTWGRELAAMLQKVHEEGLVYRDLKLENVLIAPDGQLRLLDFEFACEIGAENPLQGLGTRGYFSPQRAAGGPPAVTDDVYSLGALLYSVLTNASVPVAPHPFDLLKRPAELLNPAAGPALVDVISRCLAPDPSARFPSMADLDDALAKIGAGARVSPAPFGKEPASRTESDARRRSRELAGRLGDTLCKEARRPPDGEGLVWMSKSIEAGGMPLRDLCIGVAGTVLAFAELVGELEDPRHRDVLTEGARWLAEAPRLTGGEPLPGLYVGEAGVGAALLRAGQVLGDDELVSLAAGRGCWISSLPYASSDLFNGTAGRLRFHLLLSDETNDPEHLRHATEAGEKLLESAEGTEGDAFYWRTPPGYGPSSGVAFPGYAHGAAGIADALLDLYEATGDERYLTAVRGAGRWLLRFAVPVLDDRNGLDWPHVEGDPPAGAVWCHGATGVGRFFLHAARLGVMAEAADAAKRAARTVARGARSQGPTQCHGLAGNIEFLLDLFRETGDGAYLAEARSLGLLLEAFSREKDGLLVWPSDFPDTFSPDYTTGYAGVAACLLRLANPERLPHQLSLAGFRYRASSLPRVPEAKR